MPAAPQEQIAPNAFEYVVAIGIVEKTTAYHTHAERQAFSAAH
jgi:hypothetical protein